MLEIAAPRGREHLGATPEVAVRRCRLALDYRPSGLICTMRIPAPEGSGPTFGWLAAAAVPLVLLGRLFAVSIPVLALSRIHSFVRGTIPVLTWGGLRGGISIALALSLPEVAEKSVILAATYAVVLFTIVVQGLSLRLLVQRVVK